MAELTSNQVCNICCIHYNAGLRCCALGSLVEGGYLFAKQGGLAWIVACSSRQVSRAWASRADAVTVAQASNACGNWFIPSRIDLLMGHDCKGYWDSYNNAAYWSSTEYYSSNAHVVAFYGGHLYNASRSTTFCVRAFRTVSY